MTADQTRLDLPLAILRRLESIEAELPRTPGLVPARTRRSHLTVVPTRVAGRTRPLPAAFSLGSAAVAIGILVAVATVANLNPLANPSGVTGTPSTAVGSTGPSAGPSAVASSPPSPSPSPTPVKPSPEASVRIVTGKATVMTLLGKELRGCGVGKSTGREGTIDAADVLAMIGPRKPIDGWLDERHLVWVGSSAEAAANAYGAAVLVRSQDEQWIVFGSDGKRYARRLETVKVRSGAAAWWLSMTLLPNPCSSSGQ